MEISTETGKRIDSINTIFKIPDTLTPFFNWLTITNPIIRKTKGHKGKIGTLQSGFQLELIPQLRLPERVIIPKTIDPNITRKYLKPTDIEVIIA